MVRRFGRHVRQQFVGYMALFIALGGVSYAAHMLPINSVGSLQIKRGAVKNSDLGRSAVSTGKLRRGAVTTGKVRDGSLLSIDFKPGQLVAGAPGATGPQGAPGPKGDTGAPGTNGSPGVSGYEQVQSAAFDNFAGGQDGGSVSCPAGKSVLGGGAFGANGELQSINSSYPSATDEWTVDMNNTSGTDSTFTVYAVCGVVQ